MENKKYFHNAKVQKNICIGKHINVINVKGNKKKRPILTDKSLNNDYNLIIKYNNGRYRILKYDLITTAKVQNIFHIPKYCTNKNC